MKKTLWIFQIISCAVLLNGCGGESTPVHPPTSTATHFSVVTPGAANGGVPFQFTVTALDTSNATVTGYTGKVHFTSADGQAKLPADVSLSGGAAQLSATLETAGNQTIVATDAVSATITGTSNAITVTALPALAITSGNPPNGQVGVDYGPSSTADFKCIWSPILGWHLVCSPCSGTTGCTSLGTCAGILNPSPCHQRRQVFLGFTFTATGGLPPYTWALSPDSPLPPELNLSSSGMVTGKPTTPGPFSTTVTVSDSAVPQTQVSANYPIVIAPPQPPAIDAVAHLPIGTLDSPYVGFTFTANGTPPFTWGETGVLPQGMSPLSADGVLSGTPSQTGTFPITVTVQDSFGQSASPKDLTLQILSKGFVPTGGMGTARNSHTATLLNSGKVLVTGGAGVAAELATAELFDPATKSFSSTGSMSTDRASHTATLLNGGKVLVTGGSDAEGKALAVAEIFDPASGTFAATGSMGAARYDHTATSLNNGKVLVAGGLRDASTPLSAAELFDAASGNFAPTADMSAARSLHTATLLSDGEVLVTGGQSLVAGAISVSSSAELYQ